MHVNRLAKRDEEEAGLVALLVAVLAVVLFGVGALAIDLGNAYTRARSIQNQADFAALSVGDLLPAKTQDDRLKVADRIANYIKHFGLQDDRVGGPLTYTGQQLLDSNAVTFPSPNRVSFDAPDVQVDFGLGRLIGLDSIKVRRAADVQVKGLDQEVVAPMYAVVGCDYGSQVLKDEPNGKTPPSTLPNLDDPGSSDKQIDLSTISPSSAAENQNPQPTLALTGDFESNGSSKPRIDQVGFFRDTNGPYSPYHVYAKPTDVTANSASLVVPSDVLAHTGVWFLRVAQNGQWSDAKTSNSFTVGAAATATCPAGSDGGNFGELDFGDEAAKKDDIAHIFKSGPNHDVVAHPGPIGDGTCPGITPDLIYDGTVDDANCVSTSTGFDPDGPTQGLLSDTDARLHVDTSPRCGSTRTTVGTWSVNNDYLSCFFTDTTTTIATIANGSYTGPPVLSPDIVKSPRFFFVPVFSSEPSTGKKAYRIVGFRPAFLTDQPTTATKSDGPTADNGITIGSNSKVAALTFILFNEKALPPTLDSGPPASPTYSFGPKIVTMVN